MLVQMVNSKNSLDIFLIVSSILFLHLNFFDIFNYPITAGFVLSFFLLVKKVHCLDLSIKKLLIIAILVSFSSILHANIWLVDNEAFSNYWKSQLIIVYSFVYFALITGSKNVFGADVLYRALLISLMFLCLYIFVQYFSYLFLGIDYFFGIFGDYSYRGTIHPPLTQGSLRAYGLYLEPSYCALVLLSLFTGIIIKNKLTLSITAIVLLSLILIGSLYGLFVFSILILSYLFLYKLHNLSFSVKLFCFVLLITVSVSICIGFMTLDNFGRFNELTKPGSSGYFRFIAPFNLSIDTLLNTQLGHGPGSVEKVMYKENISMGPNSRQTSLDNGIYLMIVYYGILGLIFVSILALNLVISILKNEITSSIYYLFIFLSFGFTGGGIFNIEYIFLISLLYFCKIENFSYHNKLLI